MSNRKQLHVLVLWVLEVRSTVGAPDWARVQFNISVLKWSKCFYIKHTNGNISYWCSALMNCVQTFQFHYESVFSSIVNIFWSCVFSVEMSVSVLSRCWEMKSVDSVHSFKSFDELSDLTLPLFLSFPSTCGPFLRTGSVFQIWTDRWKTNFIVESLHQNSAQLHPPGFISVVYCVLNHWNCVFTLTAVMCC